MFEKNTRKKKAYRGKHCIKSRANIKQIIRCTESTHFIDLSINDKSADACVTFMHICVRYYAKSFENTRNILIASCTFTMYINVNDCSPRIWHENKSAQNIEQSSFDIKVTDIYTYRQHMRNI